jgi:hypothetical protein
MIVARQERKVEWGDYDPARIVFNPRFFEWFDALTGLIFETAGVPKRDLLRRPDFDGIPVVETRARFHRIGFRLLRGPSQGTSSAKKSRVEPWPAFRAHGSRPSRGR